MSGITVEQLRAKYPDPKRTSVTESLQDDSYCVGGSLLKEIGWSTTSCTCFGGSRPASPSGRAESMGSEAHLPDCDGVEIGMFPDPLILAHGLRVVNPSLSSARARSFATLIVRKNDTGNFETAWGLLADALAWTDEAWTPEDDAALSEWAEESR